MAKIISKFNDAVYIYSGEQGGMVVRELIHLQQGSQVQLPTRSNNFLSGGQFLNGREFPMLARKHSFSEETS